MSYKPDREPTSVGSSTTKDETVENTHPFSSLEHDEMRSPSFRRSASRSAVNRLKSVELHHYNCKSCAQPTSEPVDSVACRVETCQECNLGMTVSYKPEKRVLKSKTRKPITKKEDLNF